MRFMVCISLLRERAGARDPRARLHLLYPGSGHVLLLVSLLRKGRSHCGSPFSSLRLRTISLKSVWEHQLPSAPAGGDLYVFRQGPSQISRSVMQGQRWGVTIFISICGCIDAFIHVHVCVHTLYTFI